MKIFVSCLPGVSLAQSFTDTVSLLWTPAKSFRVICLPRHRTDASHLEPVRMPAISPPRSVWAGLLPPHHLQKDWISGLQSRCLKPTGESRQQSCAGWCLPKCGLKMG